MSTRHHPPGIAPIRRVRIYYVRGREAFEPTIKQHTLRHYIQLQREGRIRDLRVITEVKL